jgi:hypothetical protein
MADSTMVGLAGKEVKRHAMAIRWTIWGLLYTYNVRSNDIASLSTSIMERSRNMHDAKDK